MLICPRATAPAAGKGATVLPEGERLGKLKSTTSVHLDLTEHHVDTERKSRIVLSRCLM